MTTRVDLAQLDGAIEHERGSDICSGSVSRRCYMNSVTSPRRLT